MTVIDPAVRRPTQTLHDQNRLASVAHLEHLRADVNFHLLADQARRHGVGVLLHLDRAAAAYSNPLTLQRIQPALRQRMQACFLPLKRFRTAEIPARDHGAQELPILLAAAEIPTAAQFQFLVQRLLEAPMTLLAIAVLVSAGGIGRLGGQTVVAHQGPIAGRELFEIAVLVHRESHAVGAMPFRHGAEFPERALQTFAQTRETLREADCHVLPVRTRQHEVIKQMRKWLARDRHAERVHVSEVR